MKLLATFKHISSKNADYGAAEAYLTFEHDEFTMKPTLDENGRLVPREGYRLATLNCGEEDFAVACLRSNLRYGKNQKREDVKSHHYIISFDPRDGTDNGLTVDKAQSLGEEFCNEHFPGHQAIVCTHPDGHNHSGNIHVHIVINSLRIEAVPLLPYMDRPADTKDGCKHRCTDAAMEYFKSEVMEMCHRENLYQIDLLHGSKNRVTEREYWAQKKGQLALDMVGTSVSTSPLIFVIAALFTILTVLISTRKPAKKAAKISPLEAIRYTEQNAYKKSSAKRTNRVKLSRMAFSNLGRNRRRSAFIIISLLLCIVLFNSIIIVTQSLDEEKWVNRVTRTDFNVYNSAAFNVMESVQHHEDTLSQQAVDLIAGQPGVEDERYLYRNTKDDRNVLVDYGFEDLSGIELFHEEEGVVNQSYQGYSLYTSSDTERRYFGNVMGASENFWADMRIFEGEKDAETLTQKMATGEYVIIGCPMDKLTEEPRNTPLTDQLQVGESISFYKDGELVKTSTILAKAILVGTETETPTGTTAQAHIAADAPFVYLPDTVFKEIYDAPTLLTYGFNVDEALQPQMEEFLSSYVSENTSVAYTSTKLLKEQLDSVRSMILVIGGLIGCIMAFAGLINFANMIITNIITRRHEFATMQSIGMTGKQLRRLTVYEGIYYAVGADIIGGAVAAILAVTVLKSALNGPSMWFFTLNITLVPVLVIGVLYLLLAAVIPLIVLHFFNKGTVVERLRTSE